MIINKQCIDPRSSPSTHSPLLQEQHGEDTTQSRLLPGVPGVGSRQDPAQGEPGAAGARGGWWELWLSGDLLWGLLWGLLGGQHGHLTHPSPHLAPLQ